MDPSSKVIRHRVIEGSKDMTVEEELMVPIKAITNFNQAKTDRDGQITSPQRQECEVQSVPSAFDELPKYHLSKSWRLKHPLRKVSQLGRQVMRLVRIYKNYRTIYPGVSGLKRLSYRCVDSILKGGFKGLRYKVSLHASLCGTARPQESSSSILKIPLLYAAGKQCGANRIDLLHTYFEKDLSVNPTILFDHDGGGGTNAYTHELVKNIHADGGTVLRVYCFDAV